MTALSAVSSSHFQVSSNLIHISIKKQQQQRQLQRIVWRDSIISSIKQLLAAAIIKCDSSKNSSSRLCWDRKMSSISSIKQLSSNYQQHQAIISKWSNLFHISIKKQQQSCGQQRYQWILWHRLTSRRQASSNYQQYWATIISNKQLPIASVASNYQEALSNVMQCSTSSSILMQCWTMWGSWTIHGCGSRQDTWSGASWYHANIWPTCAK